MKMSSSSCYDDSPTEVSEDSSDEMEENDSDDEKTIVITKTKIVARRFESWHEKFLSYREILEYLLKLTDLYNHKCTLERLGYSRENRPICLVKIKSEQKKFSSMSILVEAGSDGRQKMTVSSVLYLIEYLVKNDIRILVQYLIIPCLNPDAYDKCLKLKRRNSKDSEIDLTKCYPKDMNVENLSDIQTKPREIPPNCLMLLKVIDKYKLTMKLFISLQAFDSTITYPLDYYFREVYEYALACKKSMGWDSLDVKPIVPCLTDNIGTSVEHVIRNYHDNIQFAYILNVHNKSFIPDEKFILSKGDQTLTGISTLTKRVYRYHTKQKFNYHVKTVVKLLDTTD